MDAAGSSRVILLHTRRDLQEAVTAGPVLVLDATMPMRIVRHYLPRLEVLADLQAAAPYLETFQIVGGWGKTSIIQSSRASVEENCRRDRMLQELRDFVVFHSGGNALVVTYEAIEDRFSEPARCTNRPFQQDCRLGHVWRRAKPVRHRASAS